MPSVLYIQMAKQHFQLVRAPGLGVSSLLQFLEHLAWFCGLPQSSLQCFHFPEVGMAAPSSLERDVSLPGLGVANFFTATKESEQRPKKLFQTLAISYFLTSIHLPFSIYSLSLSCPWLFSSFPFPFLFIRTCPCLYEQSIISHWTKALCTYYLYLYASFYEFLSTKS